MMRVEKQLAVFMDNRPGVLAKTCQALARGQVNILALSILDTVDHAIVRMVVDKPQEAERILAGQHALIQERDVLCLDVPNAIGALARVAERLTESGINIEYAYCTVSAGQSEGVLVLRTNDLEATISVLG